MGADQVSPLERDVLLSLRENGAPTKQTVSVTRSRPEVAKVLAQPEVRETLSKAGADPVGSSPEQFGAFIRSETVKWGAAVKRAGITPE